MQDFSVYCKLLGFIITLVVVAFVGAFVVRFVGRFVGPFVGRFVGALVGRLVGALVGRFVGAFVGACVGFFVGAFVGSVGGAPLESKKIYVTKIMHSNKVIINLKICALLKTRYVKRDFY